VLHHLTLWVPDLKRAVPSWTWLLAALGYESDATVDRLLVFRRGGFALVLEESDDMVPGMLYSRMRPGMNHLAFALDSPEVFERVVAEAPSHGWSALPVDRHPIAGGSQVAYLEDRNGFEVELVAPSD